MRVVHLADLHLGHVRFTKQTGDLRNQRQVDVSATFERMVTQVVALAPDLIVIAGDVFDKPHTRNHVFTTALAGLRRMREVAPVVVISGNHDIPGGVGGRDTCSLKSFRALGVHVVDEGAEVIRVGECAVTCVPEKVAHTVAPVPIDARYNVLLLHGEILGAIPGTRAHDHSIDAERLTSHPWDYIALGHYHVTTEVAPRCWYAGAMDYVSSNVWGELEDERRRGLAGKGFLEVDLDTHVVARHAIEGTRRWIDLPRIDGRDLSSDTLDELLVANLRSVDLTDAVVRQVITDVPRDRSKDMKWKQRKITAAAFEFVLDVRRPVERQVFGVGNSPAAVRRKLEDIWREKLAGWTLPDDLVGERERFVNVGVQYLKDTEEAEELQVLPAPQEVAA